MAELPWEIDTSLTIEQIQQMVGTEDEPVTVEIEKGANAVIPVSAVCNAEIEVCTNAVIPESAVDITEVVIINHNGVVTIINIPGRIFVSAMDVAVIIATWHSGKSR